MFPEKTNELGRYYRLAVIGLSLLSAAALAITVWMLVDFMKEQSIVAELLSELPSGAKGPAEILAGDLRWQFRLTILLVINVVMAGIAIILLWRAYHASQTSLREFTALATDVLSSMDQGVITTDLKGDVTSINRRGLEFLGISESNVIGPLAKLTPIPLNEYRKDWMHTRSSSTVQDFTVDNNGIVRRLRAFCQILRDHDDNEVGNVLQLHDVSERILIEERMRRMERYIGLGSLAGGLHHEIKNPLAALSLHVQLLEEQLDSENTSQENRQMLGIIGTEVARIGEVLEGFRDFASIDNLNITLVDVAAMIGQQVELMRPQASKQGVKFALDFGDGAVEISADRTRLEQVLLNLIINALESMPDGGTIRIGTRREHDSLRIEVADGGCGVPSNVQDKILEPYVTTKSTGTGLGLALCDKIVRQHDGVLEFYSSSDGTTFEVTLPMEPAKVLA